MREAGRKRRRKGWTVLLSRDEALPGIGLEFFGVNMDPFSSFQAPQLKKTFSQERF